MIDLQEIAPVQLLPEALGKDPCIRALSYALQRQTEKLLEQIGRTAVYAAVDILPEDILDILAAELRAQYYDAAMEIEMKRTTVKKALLWYEKAGTLKTVKELTQIVWGENVISEWFEHDGRPYTFWMEVMALDAWITDQGMADFMAALQKVKNTRSLLDRIIFHRRLDTLLHSGAVQDSYKREVIIDFFHESQTDEFRLHTGAYQENHMKRAVVDFYEEQKSERAVAHVGGAPVILRRQSIVQEE